MIIGPQGILQGPVSQLGRGGAAWERIEHGEVTITGGSSGYVDRTITLSQAIDITKCILIYHNTARAVSASGTNSHAALLSVSNSTELTLRRHEGSYSFVCCFDIWEVPCGLVQFGVDSITSSATSYSSNVTLGTPVKDIEKAVVLTNAYGWYYPDKQGGVGNAKLTSASNLELGYFNYDSLSGTSRRAWQVWDPLG